MKKIAVFSSILGIGILIGAAALVLQNKQTNEEAIGEENLESTEEYQKYSDAVDHQINDPYIDDVKSEYDLSNQ